MVTHPAPVVHVLNAFFVRASVRTGCGCRQVHFPYVSIPSSSGRTFGLQSFWKDGTETKSQSLLRQDARSDGPDACPLHPRDRRVSIPSSSGRTFGLRLGAGLRGRGCVSIPSSSGRTFGPGDVRGSGCGVGVSIPSSSGRTFGRWHRKARAKRQSRSQSLLRQGARSDTESAVRIRLPAIESQSLLRQGARSDRPPTQRRPVRRVSQSLLRQGARSDTTDDSAADELLSQSLLRQGARSDGRTHRGVRQPGMGLNPFFVRAHVRTELLRDLAEACQSQSLLRQGARSDWQRTGGFVENPSLNPFFVRAHVRTRLFRKKPLTSASQSLLRQGARSDDAAAAAADAATYVSIPSSSGRTFGLLKMLKSAQDAGLNPFFVRAHVRTQRCASESVRSHASQSLLRQGARSDSNNTRNAMNRAAVSIPSSSGRTFGRRRRRRRRRLNPFFVRAHVRTALVQSHAQERAVSIPSSSGRTFGRITSLTQMSKR